MSVQMGSSIVVITRTDEHDSRSDRIRLVSQTLEVSELKAQFQRFLLSLQSIIDVSESSSESFQLAEVQFNAEISGSGEFKLLGTGIGLEATSGVTFVLQRRKG